MAVGFGDLVQCETMSRIRVIGVELRCQIGMHREELALLPADVLVPNPRHHPAVQMTFPITIHTTVGDFSGDVVAR